MIRNNKEKLNSGWIVNVNSRGGDFLTSRNRQEADASRQAPRRLGKKKAAQLCADVDHTRFSPHSPEFEPRVGPTLPLVTFVRPSFPFPLSSPMSEPWEISRSSWQNQNQKQPRKADPVHRMTPDMTYIPTRTSVVSKGPKNSIEQLAKKLVRTASQCLQEHQTPSPHSGQVKWNLVEISLESSGRKVSKSHREHNSWCSDV